MGIGVFMSELCGERDVICTLDTLYLFRTQDQHLID